MSKKDLFGDDSDTSSKEEFAQYFTQSLAQLKMPRVKDSFSAEILSVGKEEVFVQLTPSSDGILLRNEIRNKEGSDTLKVGDKVDVVVTRIQDGEIRVSRTGTKKVVADLGSLEDAFDMELPIEGKVLEACKGGYKVQVMNATAFCPLSQMDHRLSSEADAYIGKKFEFLVTQFDANKRNIVVSRRRLLDQQRLENEGEALQKMKPGDLVDGKVVRVETFGAFVEIDGGVQGLIHVSELSWSRVNDAKSIIQPGATVRVQILKIEEIDGRLKIGLSLKQGGGESDPWLLVEQNYPVGSIHQGTVEKREAYGLFVNIGPGVTGLLPKSKWRDDLEAKSYDIKKPGDVFPVQVEQINSSDRKISLRPPSEKEDESWKEHGAVSTHGFSSSAQVAGKGFGTLGGLADALGKLKK